MPSILAVDDSASMRQMVAFTLKGAGYTVVEAADGQQAWELAQQTQVDLVLTDQNMPTMDGLTLVEKLRAHPAYRNTPILILTTESSDAMKARGRAAGAPHVGHEFGDLRVRPVAEVTGGLEDLRLQLRADVSFPTQSAGHRHLGDAGVAGDVG